MTCIVCGDGAEGYYCTVSGLTVSACVRCVENNDIACESREVIDRLVADPSFMV